MSSESLPAGNCWCEQHNIDSQSRLTEFWDGLTSRESTVLTEATRPLVIFGSRSLTQHTVGLRDRRDLIADHFADTSYDPDLIISGGADGGDAIAEALALQFDVPAVVLAVNSVDDSTQFRWDLADAPWVCDTVTAYGDDDPADPATGRGAYMTRNCLMAALTSRLNGAGLALWDGDSPGTEAMIKSCRSHDLPVGVFTIPPAENDITEVRFHDPY